MPLGVLFIPKWAFVRGVFVFVLQVSGTVGTVLPFCLFRVCLWGFCCFLVFRLGDERGGGGCGTFLVLAVNFLVLCQVGARWGPGIFQFPA